MIIFDIETVGNKGMTAYLPEITPPGNYKKPETIQKWMDENLAGEQQNQLSKMALDPLLSQVKAIGMNGGTTNIIYIVSAGLPEIPDISFCCFETEQEMLADFWQAVSEYRPPLIGFNSNSFDLPILYWRSMMLDVKVKLPRFNRYSHTFVDLLDILKLNNPRISSMTSMGLKNVGKMLGIESNLSDVDGSQVATMTDVEVVSYLNNDIDLTVKLFNRMAGVYFPPVEDGNAF